MLHATTLRLPVVEVEGGTLTSLAGFDGHQGVALVVEPRRWASPDEILARAAERRQPPFVLVLDSLEDPQNLGTLLRSAEASGVHGVLFPTRRAAPVTPAAVKASAGAVEHLLLAPVDDLPGALADLRARGLRVVAADQDAPLGHRDADLRGPLALVVGSEGAGLSPAIRRRVDLFVRIPMAGRVASLNAAVAGTVLLFEAAGQRGLERSGAGDATRDGTPVALAAAASGPRDGMETTGAETTAAEIGAAEDAESGPKDTTEAASAVEDAEGAEETSSAADDAEGAEDSASAAEGAEADELLPGERSSR